MNSTSQSFDLQQPINIFSLSFIIVILLALGVNKVASDNLATQNELLSYVYGLQRATDLSIAQMGNTLKGDSEAFKQLQSANEAGILSLNILQNGSLKKDIDPAPSGVQEALEPYSKSWHSISQISAKVLQTRSQLQVHGDKVEVIEDSLNKLVSMQQPIIEALIRSESKAQQILIASQQQQLLYEIKASWLNTQYGSAATRAAAFQQLYATSKTFTLNQKKLLNGSTDESLIAVQDPQVRRLIANVSTQLETTEKLMNDSIVAGKAMQALHSEISKLRSQQHIFHQQAAHLAVTTKNLNSSFWIQHWQIYALLAFAAGIYLFVATRLKRPMIDNTENQEEEKIFDSTAPNNDVTTTHANRLKAAQNQLINEVRQLGEGKIYFDVTDTNESTREIAQAYNQSKKRLILLLTNIRKQNTQINQSISAQQKQAESGISKQLTMLGDLKNNLPSIVSSLNPQVITMDEIKSSLELSNKIRARLSLANEKLNKLARVEPSRFSEKEFSALQAHIEKLLGSLDEAEIEQEQLTVYLKDLLKGQDNKSANEGNLKSIITDFNPQLNEMSVHLNQLEDIIREVFKLYENSASIFNLLEIEQTTKKVERSPVALV